MKKKSILQQDFLIEKILFFFYCVVALILLFSHVYNDILATTRHGINFWQYLFSGDFFNFYALNVCPPGNEIYTTVQRCSYNILVYILFAVWDFPLYLLERFANIDVLNNIFCIVYAKLLVVATMIVSTMILKKILCFLGAPKQQQLIIIYLYLTSTLMISTVFNITQYDLMSVVFQLFGFYAFLQKKNRAFIFWFGIAFCFKYFSLIIFLPLLLLRYKKIMSWIKALFVMILPLVLTKLPFILFSTTTKNVFANEALSANLGEMMLSNSFSFINLFVLVYPCLLVWCYLQKDHEDRRGHFIAIWVCFVAYAAFCGLLKLYPYWTILLAPFTSLLFVLSPKKNYINILLETIGYSALFLMNMLQFTWCYFGKTMQPMMMSLFVDNSRLNFDSSLIYEIITQLSANNSAVSVVTSVFVAAMCALAYITFPKKNLSDLSDASTMVLDKDVLIVRFLATVGLCLLPMVSLFI